MRFQKARSTTPNKDLLSSSIEVELVADVFRRGALLFVGEFSDLKNACSRRRVSVAPDVLARIEREQGISGGFCIPVGNGESVIYFRQPPQTPMLVHEVCHATRRMLDEIGVDDDEAFAYLAEHLFAQAISCVDASRSPSSKGDASPRTSSRTSRHGNRDRRSRSSSSAR